MKILLSAALILLFAATPCFAEFQYPEEDRALVTKLRSAKARQYRFSEASMETVFVLLARDAQIACRDLENLPAISISIASFASPFSTMEELAEKYGFRLNHVDGKWQVEATPPKAE